VDVGRVEMVGREQYLDAVADDVLHLVLVPGAGVGQQHARVAKVPTARGKPVGADA
jgi:hypothetical protein